LGDDDDADDDVIDCIPLYEITSVKKMTLNLGDFHRKSSSHSEGGNEHLSSDGFPQTLRIDTKPEGYNSGRTYYLQFGSDADFWAISISRYVKDAIKRFEAKRRSPARWLVRLWAPGAPPALLERHMPAGVSGEGAPRSPTPMTLDCPLEKVGPEQVNGGGRDVWGLGWWWWW
jgi:hypothetical protein